MHIGGPPVTEVEWLAGARPTGMVESLKDKASGRRLRLLTSGLIRLFPQYLNTAPARLLLDTFEDYADDLAVYDDVMGWEALMEQHRRCVAGPGGVVCEMLVDLTQRERWSPSAYWLARVAVSEVGRVVIYARDWPEHNEDLIQHSVRRAGAIVGDIFGNPFRPVSFDPEWRTSTAVALSKQMYESRDFGTMPILADALQDAGCDNADVLNHCRDEKQVHVRGCWVVDLVLGKE